MLHISTLNAKAVRVIPTVSLFIGSSDCSISFREMKAILLILLPCHWSDIGSMKQCLYTPMFSFLLGGQWNLNLSCILTLEINRPFSTASKWVIWNIFNQRFKERGKDDNTESVYTLFIDVLSCVYCSHTNFCCPEWPLSTNNTMGSFCTKCTFPNDMGIMGTETRLQGTSCLHKKGSSMVL